MNKGKHNGSQGAEPAREQETAEREAQAAQENVPAEETNDAALKMDAVLKERDQAMQERDEYLNLAQRVKADFENYKRRNQNAREDAYNEAVQETVAKFLPVLDNLDRAAAAEGNEESLRSGVQLVLKQFNAVLTAAGVEEIPAEGQFDPNLHHAVIQEQAEGAESGAIVAVLQKGYRLGGRVLRHSMVKVAE